MPFVSKQQERWMFANKPKMAKEWASKTPDIRSLPQRVKKKKSIASNLFKIATAKAKV